MITNQVLKFVLSWFLITTIINWYLMTLPIIDVSKRKYPNKYLIKNANRIDFQSGYECSAFSTAYLLRHFRIETDGNSVYKDMPCKMKSGNVYPKGIRKFLKRSGFKTHFYKGNINQLKKQISKGIPVIVFIKVNTKQKYRHYVPVIGYDDNYFYIAESLEYLANSMEEPECYNRKVSIDDFKKLWDIKEWYMPFYSNTYITVK